MILHGDCLEKLKEIESNSIDSIVTDPPYGLSFMGKKWDYDVPSVDIWKECFRVLKPGGHLLAFAGTRTQHRMAVKIEDAGFEIRDMIAWVYGSGFPKSLNIGKALDKKEGNLEESTETLFNNPDKKTDLSKRSDYGYKFEPKSELAKQWQGFGTSLKPALEPITVARKPLIGTVAQNVLTYGTGGINIDGCRVGTEDNRARKNNTEPGFSGGWGAKDTESNPLGRFPANLIHDGSEEVIRFFPNDSQRFFYCPKASKKDRDEGLEGFEVPTEQLSGLDTRGRTLEREDGTKTLVDRWKPNPRANNHPTVKPTDLMRYLCRLVTPPKGIVLDPFMGSGSTGKAAKLEGFEFIGIEREEEYVKIAEARINSVAVLV